jgi:hypothetical protein
VFKIPVIVALGVLAAACGTSQPRHLPPQPAAPSAAPPEAVQGNAYRIDATQSELRVLVYRAGPLAHFGHNHVMVNRSLRGEVSVAADVAATSFRLIVPVDRFSVDDEEARHEEGADFSNEVPDDAKAGTRANMLGAAVLDAAGFPEITVTGVSFQGSPSDYSALAHQRSLPASGAPEPGRQLIATVAVKVAGHESRIDVPATLFADRAGIAATGVVEVRQSALGLTPYSLMLGALQVQDALVIKFKIVATAG